MLFAFSNASFIWAIRTVIGQFQTESQRKAEQLVRQPDPVKGVPVAGALKEWSGRLRKSVESWLPHRGQAIGWRQIVGGLFFFPLLVAVRASTDYFGG